MGRKNFSQGGIRVRVTDDGGRQSFSQHDDRVGGGSVNRVWRRGGGGGGGGRGGGGQHQGKKSVSFNDRLGGIKKRLGPQRGGRGGGAMRNIVITDGDEDMSGSNSYQAGRARPSVRGFKRGRGRGGRGARINASTYIRRAGGTDGSKSWHKVQISNGSKYAKEELLKSLYTASPQPFAPICYQKMGAHTIFYVESREMADALKGLNHNLTLPDGFKLTMHIALSPPPQCNITSDVVDKVKAVMGSPDRYLAEHKSLNMKKFYADPKFWGEPVYASLSRTQLMKHVVDIIGENIPMVEALEFSDNRIYSLEGFQDLALKAPNVKILFLGSNNIRDLKELEKCSHWKLQQLKLTGNPVVAAFNNTAAYQKAVRKIFPSLITLDDAELPKLITFDGEESDGPGVVPPALQKMSVASPEQEQVVNQFAETYFKIYDSDSRQNLMEAYHPEALMSMSATYPAYDSVQAKGFGRYRPDSRNLLRIQHQQQRQKTLHHGPLSIVSFLNELPRTCHDFGTFTLDVTLAIGNVIAFNVTGLFKETDGSASLPNQPIRHFSRMFVIMKNVTGDGFKIVNETLLLTIPSTKELKSAAAAATAPSPASTPSVQDEAAMRAMIQQLCQRTNMNERFSKMCLEEAGWNLEQALGRFQVAQQENKIPIEAFEKM